MLQHGKACRDIGRASKKDLCCDNVMYVVTLKEETLVATDKQGCDKRCLLSELTWWQQKNPIL